MGCGDHRYRYGVWGSHVRIGCEGVGITDMRTCVMVHKSLC